MKMLIIYIILLFILSFSVLGIVSVDLGDNELPYVGINNVGSVSSLLSSNNIWTGNNTFFNITIINESVLDINYSICLGGSCILNWTDINSSNEYVLKSGDTMTGNLVIDRDNLGNASLNLTSDSNQYSCVFLVEGGGHHDGFQICNDGAGINEFAISNYETGNNYITIDRVDGEINFYNDTTFHQTVYMDYTNLTGILSAIAINVSYIYNPYTGGFMDIRASPWYLGSADLELAQDLIVGDEICFGTDCIDSWSDVNSTENYVLKSGDNMTGTGNAFACLDSNGKLYRSDVACI